MNARVRIVFPEDLIREPVVSRLVRRFDVEVNIRRASVEEHEGWIVCELDGSDEDVRAALAWLAASGISVEALGDVVEG